MRCACRPTGFYAQRLSWCVFIRVAEGEGKVLPYSYWVLAPCVILLPPHRSPKMKEILPHSADKTTEAQREGE